MKICSEIPHQTKIGEKYRTRRINTQVCFIAAGDIQRSQKRPCRGKWY